MTLYVLLGPTAVGKTEFALQMAEEAGCPNFNGMYMLLYQGAAAFELWTGQPMPVEKIRTSFFQ